jgi:hypothetical protein
VADERTGPPIDDALFEQGQAYPVTALISRELARQDVRDTPENAGKQAIGPGQGRGRSPITLRQRATVSGVLGLPPEGARLAAAPESANWPTAPRLDPGRGARLDHAFPAR